MRFCLMIAIASFLTAPLFAKDKELDCTNAAIGNEQMIVTGQNKVEVDCRAISGKTEVPIVYQITSDGSPMGNISFNPKQFGAPGLVVTTPPEKWCADDAGIITFTVAIDCDTATGQYIVWFHSGALISPNTQILVTPKKK